MKMTITAPSTVRKPLVLAVLGCCFLVVMMDNTILNVALQTIQIKLSASNSQLQWAVDSYILVYAALMISAGVLADRWGRRRTLLLGLAIFAAASLMSAFAHSPDQLILWRAVMGLGGAVVPPAALAIIKDVFDEKEQGKAMGVWAALGGLSVAFGPILAGVLLEHFWWGSVFLINAPIVAICAVVILAVVPESRAQHRRRLDIPGVLLSMFGIAALVYGVIRGGETNHWLAADALGAISAGLVLMGLLVIVERRRAEPALDVSLFRNAAFTAGTLSISAAFLALTGGTFLLVFYVLLVRGNSPLELGLILLPVAIGSVVAALGSTAVVARRGPRVAVVAGLAFLLLSMLGLCVVGESTTLWLLEIALLFGGLGMGLVMGTTTPLVMSAVPAEKSGVGAAVNNTLRQVGAALGVAIMGTVYSIRYSAELGETVQRLPAALRDEASNSLGGTLLGVQRLAHTPGSDQPSARELAEIAASARSAFVAAMHSTLLVAAGVLVLSIVLGMIWLPKGINAPIAADSQSDELNELARAR
jgi:EmrB/QacA subfamily drug resistance transporter